MIFSLKKKGLDALVMDLRDNSVGSAEYATALLNLFVMEPVVAKYSSRTGLENMTIQNPVPPLLDVPIVVLVNQASGGAK